MKKNKTPSVVILTSVIPPRLYRMLDGIARFSRENGPWRIYQAERRLWAYNFSDWKKWGADAIICADHHPEEEARQIVDAHLPTVVLLQPHNMRGRGYPLRKFSCCLWDSDAIGRMAAHYFIDRGYQNFAFVDDPLKETYWSKDRERAFRRELKASAPTGFRYCRYGGATEEEWADWMNERPRLSAWLRQLPKPCAVFAPNDRRGKQVIDACIEEGIPVPGELAVLGVDDDPWICEMSLPTLSSIRCDVESAGYAIASHLDGLIRGKGTRRIEIPVKPLEVTTRQSTDWMAVNDDKIASTLEFIQHNFSDASLRVDVLARRAAIARRTLEKRFVNATRRTLHEEIEYVRLSHAKALLKGEGRSIPLIAKDCGYNSPIHFSRMFEKRFGVSPLAYRSMSRT